MCDYVLSQARARTHTLSTAAKRIALLSFIRTSVSVSSTSRWLDISVRLLNNLLFVVGLFVGLSALHLS